MDGERSHDRRLSLIARLSLLRHTISFSLSFNLFFLCCHMVFYHLSISDEGREGEKVISMTSLRGTTHTDTAFQSIPGQLASAPGRLIFFPSHGGGDSSPLLGREMRAGRSCASLPSAFVCVCWVREVIPLYGLNKLHDISRSVPCSLREFWEMEEFYRKVFSLSK